MSNKHNITPQTYIDINKELEDDNIPFEFAISTQEKIDNWINQPSPPYQTPPQIDMVAEMWRLHNLKKENESHES